MDLEVVEIGVCRDGLASTGCCKCHEGASGNDARAWPCPRWVGIGESICICADWVDGHRLLEVLRHRSTTGIAKESVSIDYKISNTLEIWSSFETISNQAVILSVRSRGCGEMSLTEPAESAVLPLISDAPYPADFNTSDGLKTAV